MPGANEIISTTMCGITNQPAAHPARNSGTALKKKPKTNFFSWRVNAGVMNAKI